MHGILYQLDWSSILNFFCLQPLLNSQEVLLIELLDRLFEWEEWGQAMGDTKLLKKLGFWVLFNFDFAFFYGPFKLSINILNTLDFQLSDN
jgi:hypothetical protein